MKVELLKNCKSIVACFGKSSQLIRHHSRCQRVPNAPVCLKKINLTSLELNKNQKHPSITRLRFHLFLRIKLHWCDAKVWKASGDGEIRFLWCKLRTVISQFASASGCDASNTRQLTTSQRISS
jgi:hypothetical protein